MNQVQTNGATTYAMKAIYSAAILFLATAAGGATFEVIHSSAEFPVNEPIESGLIVGSDGRLYGVVTDAWDVWCGYIFSMKPDGTDFVREWTASTIGELSKGVFRAQSGVFYGLGGLGSISPGNTPGSGIVFSVDLETNVEKQICVLDPAVVGSWTTPLLVASNGKIYGGTQLGGPGLNGVIYSVDPDSGATQVLRVFDRNANEGSVRGPLIEGSDGRLYGVAEGEASHRGILFSLEKDGTDYKVVLSFGYAAGRLTQGEDGRLFGAMPEGGLGNSGAIYSVNPDGSDLKVLHHFDYAVEGAEPMGGLLVTGGKIYGSLRQGGPFGAWGYGSVYSINVDGSDFRALHFFDGELDVSQPNGGLVVGPDGRIYGTSQGQSVGGLSTIFRIDPTVGALPEIVSAPSAGGTYLDPFEFRIVANNGPTGFAAVGLPPGLTIDSQTGIITGYLNVPGEYPVQIAVTNPDGTTYGELAISVAKRHANIEIRETLEGYDGTPKTVTAQAWPSHLKLVVTYNGSTKPPTAIGTYQAVIRVDDPFWHGEVETPFRIEDPAIMPPRIKVQPFSPIVHYGYEASFSVVATGGPPLSYQWRFAGADIPGANEATYKIPKVAVSDGWGLYDVVITNPFGTISSNRVQIHAYNGPVILEHPESVAAIAGSDVIFKVVVSSTEPVTYEWRKMGTGLYYLAEGGQFTLYNVQPKDEGNYVIRVTNSEGSMETYEATLSVDTTPRLINLSCRASAGSGGETLIAGFYINGTGLKDVLIRGVGPKLKDYNVPVTVANPVIHLYKGDTVIGSNDDWEPALAPSFAAVGAFALEEGSKDAAMVATLEPGLYTVHLVNAGPVGEGLIEVYDLSRDLGARLTNVSSRLHLKAGETIILGTALMGSPVGILVRNVGPGLAKYLPNPDGVLPDPHLRLFSGSTSIALNDNWGDAAGAFFAPAGAFPLDAGSKDAAIRVEVSPGGYTVHAIDASGGGGIAIIELYESK